MQKLNLIDHKHFHSVNYAVSSAGSPTVFKFRTLSIRLKSRKVTAKISVILPLPIMGTISSNLFVEVTNKLARFLFIVSTNVQLKLYIRLLDNQFLIP